jgi:hypothetical protein
MIENKFDATLLLTLTAALCLATLTLWIPAYWPVALFEIVAFVIAGCALSRARTVASGSRLPLWILSFIIVWGCLQLATGRTVHRFATERSILQWMTLLAVYYTGAVSLVHKNLTHLARTIMIWFAFALCVEAILQAYLSPGTVYGLFPSGYHDFVMGPIVYHTHFATFVESVFPLVLLRGLRRSPRSYLFLGVAAILLTSVVVSASRGGLILVVAEAIVVLLLFYLQDPKELQRCRYVALGLATFTAVLVLIVGFETTSARFSAEPLTVGRVQFALSTLHMIAARPFLGWGLGCWPAVYPAFATFDPGAFVNQAHSDWLQWTAEGGIPVGLAMLILAVWSIKPAVRSVWGIGVLAVMVHAAFDYPFSRPAVGAWPILILAMAAATPERSASACREEKEERGPLKTA